MPANILIVEDLFIEANDLRIILERAGHSVCGVAKSVDQAMAVIKREKPDIVVVDIFLKGDLTGIHLAKYLGAQNIPFIYLSANSNSSTFEAAKATQPYGFLVKPYREKDVLVALDIAGYRHKHAMELTRRQEAWLSNLLSNIINEVASHEQKLSLLAKAFQPFVPFDLIFIDTDSRMEDLRSFYGFQRVDFSDYKSIGVAEFLRKAKLQPGELHQLRKDHANKRQVTILNGADFVNACSKDRLSEKMHQIFGVQSSLSVPIVAGKDKGLSIFFFSVQPDCFTTEQVEVLSPVRSLLASVIENIRTQKSNTGGELPVRELPATQEAQGVLSGIVGRSPNLLHVLDQAVQVAAVDSTVLISGETGVGKEGLASAIHRLSARQLKPMVNVNCAAIPETLIESELFGHEKGAFTTALERRVGKFEQAHGGTIFLDEIGELPLQVQSKLLRVLQEKEVERIGGRATVKVDVRIIAATNRNLHKEVAAGRFRMDLYYRINVFPLCLPPLRERKEDIPLLVRHFLLENARLSGTPVKTVTPEVMARFTSYSWPGNIRELQHFIERYVVSTRGNLIAEVDMPEELFTESPASAESATFRQIEEVDKTHIVEALQRCNGKVSGKGGAAEILGINPNTLTSRMRKLGITWKYILK
jgi:DNA-binding NtrC family response regulator